MSNFIQNIETGKVGKFIASIPTQGKGLLHLVEDAETGFIQAFPSLEKYKVAAQEIVDDVEAGVKVAEGVVNTPPPPAPTSDPSAPSTTEPVPPELGATGVQATPAAPAAPVADPGMPPLGA